MRALGDPDTFIPTDLGVLRAVRGLGGPHDPRALAALADAWRPWRSYAVIHLWGAGSVVTRETARAAPTAGADAVARRRTSVGPPRIASTVPEGRR